MRTNPSSSGTTTVPIAESDILWTPAPERAAASRMSSFMVWLRDERELDFADFTDLWDWSVTDLEAFWSAIVDYFEVDFSSPPLAILEGDSIESAQWFRGARLNYARHILRREHPGLPALLHTREGEALEELEWTSFADQVRLIAEQLRTMGVGLGDRVAAYLPNAPETVVAMLATTAIGAIWSCCSPDFGWRGVVDRFAPLEPKIFLYTDGYPYAGTHHDRAADAQEILRGLPTIKHSIHVPSTTSVPTPAGSHAWATLLSSERVDPATFHFEEVPFDHPLWILFSSGTTGRPKAIVHSHGGVVLEHMKLTGLHMDLQDGDRALYYTTTGWMVFNKITSSMMHGAVPVLYNGSPTFPEIDSLWRLAEESRATFFGTSPAFIDAMIKADIVPNERYDLSRIRSIMPAGSPVSPECTAWFLRSVGSDVWVGTASGGTDCCTSFVGGSPTLPVRAGEIQAPMLGVDVSAFDESGHSVVNELGELVIKRPMPSMPISFWGDDGTRLHESYFTRFPGVWHHGDLFRINSRLGSFVLGRSDATLNRSGVRIGTAEIYAAVERVDGVEDALVVEVAQTGGAILVLFVKTPDGLELDDSLARQIRSSLREDYSPRHVPDRIIRVSAIPRTRTGKRMEVPVRRVLLGAKVADVSDPNAMEDASALDEYAEIAMREGWFASTGEGITS
ncbi:MAG TPA: acetoacetate--CoA ligase [Terrimesophilobacter sp.]|nr:acetoacetate--CoA ligase [Terrimesophilobacter sp.]